jgi:suppressor of ftsI/bilirubin oxidase
MNRRRFLGAGLASLGAACGGVPATRSTNAPPPAALAGERVAALSAVRRLVIERTDPVLGRCRYLADLGTRRVLQPILVARRGESFDAVIENTLPQPTTVHFHGLTLPEAEDGAGFDPIAPGARKRASFQVKNRSGLYWFHPHPHGFTAEQVHAGLAGLLVVTDEDDDALDAALNLAPANRLAMVVSDVRQAGNSIRPYAPSDEDCLHGWLGNRALVNGALDARSAVAPGWVRLQLLNACNARGLLLGFREGERLLPFHVLGTDGGLLAFPVEVQKLFMHSGERLDIAVQAARDIDVVSLAFDPRHHVQGKAPRHHQTERKRYAPLAIDATCGSPGSADASGRLDDGVELPLFRLLVDGGSRPMPPLPQRISSLETTPAYGDAPTRRLRLDFDERAGFVIDGTPYRRDEVGFRVQRGAREIWEIRNSPISMPHPMHLHGFGFRVLRRQGTFGPARALATESGSRLASDLGVKDTVLLWPNETVWLGVDFALPGDAAFRGAQRYMFHCHNLEHEDGMMMRNFTVA